MQIRVTSLCLAVATLVPSVGLPCGNAVYLQTDEATKLVAKAEQAFDAGEYKKVRRMLEGSAWAIKNENLQRRLATVHAVSLIRTGLLTDGVTTLRWLVDLDKDNALLQTSLGEGLSGLKKGRAEALTILARLEKEDRMAHAQGWAALAKLRALDNDPEGRDRALARCKQTASSPSICTLPKGTPQAPVPKAKDDNVRS